jgi:hypothetical protein
MTIAVRITNEDTGPTARTIRVGTISYDKGKSGSREVEHQHIQPGQSALFHIYLLHDLHVEELEP